MMRSSTSKTSIPGTGRSRRTVVVIFVLVFLAMLAHIVFAGWEGCISSQRKKAIHDEWLAVDAETIDQVRLGPIFYGRDDVFTIGKEIVVTDRERITDFVVELQSTQSWDHYLHGVEHFNVHFMVKAVVSSDDETYVFGLSMERELDYCVFGLLPEEDPKSYKGAGHISNASSAGLAELVMNAIEEEGVAEIPAVRRLRDR